MGQANSLETLPHRLLDKLDAQALLLRARGERPEEVLGTVRSAAAPAGTLASGFTGEVLRPFPDAAVLGEVAGALGVHDLTLLAFRLTPALTEQATARFSDGERLSAELAAFAGQNPEASLVYLLTHANRGPLGDLTTFVGGDSHRAARGLGEAIARTHDLARVMLRKAVTVFPDVPALHGGKQGEWLVIGSAGDQIEDLSHGALAALGSVAIPAGILHSNAWRETALRAKASAGGAGRDGFTAQVHHGFPRSHFIRPDTGSPDVVSGPYWHRMCQAWHRRGFDLASFTCVPPQFHGPPSPPSRPTGYGIATTAMLLAQARFREEPHKLARRRFLVEALGGVSHYTIEALTRVYGVPPGHILGIDPSRGACENTRVHFGVRTHQGYNTEAYTSLAPTERADVWINNGLGGDIGEAEVRALLARGIRVLCGAANSFLRPAELEGSLAATFEAGALAWPDEAASGGGYVLAVMDAYLRCMNRKANTGEADELILRTIVERNRDLLLEALERSGAAADAESRGQALWREATGVVESRVESAFATSLSLAQAYEAADVRRWNLPRLPAPA